MSNADTSASEPTAASASPATNLLAEAKVEHIPLDRVDLEDRTYMFRAALRVGPLRDSIAAEGQQMPIIVRKRGQTRAMRYQIISGFRRATAMRELKAATIAAIVREDLDDEDAAFRASVLENSQRKTYSDIDRGLVIKLYEDRGHTSREIAEVMGLTERQKRNLKSLLDLPKTVQEAIGDPDKKFSATHGLVLKQLKAKFPKLNYGKWVKVVAEGNEGQGLSVAQLKRAVAAEYKRDGQSMLGSIFRESDAKKGVFRLQPVKVEVEKLSDDEKAALREELEGLLKALG